MRMRKWQSEELGGTKLDAELLFQNVGRGREYRSITTVSIRLF